MDIQSTIKRFGYTQAKVAEMLGVTTGNFSVMIRGNITVDNLRRIADAIGCNVSEFFADETPQVNARAADQDHVPGSGDLVCPHCGRSLRLSAQ